MDFTSLPNDIFLIVTQYLSPRDVVRCRVASRSWYQAFTDPFFIQGILKQEFPNAREVRQLQSAGSFQIQSQVANGDESLNWVRTFDLVAARYHALQTATPQSIGKLELYSTPNDSRRARVYGVKHWQRQLEYGRSYYRFHDSEPLWTYEDGLIIFPERGTCDLVLFDLTIQQSFKVPFDVSEKIIRRVRLQKKLLVIEWAEFSAFHKLNETDHVHRHFASLFDIRRHVSRGDGTSSWQLLFRSEFKIHFLGFPLNVRDRFFSTHSASHYAVYVWQPNRSAWGEDEPIESLTLWDVSKASAYRPSEDPPGNHKPRDESGPFVLRKLGYRDLDFYSIRQGTAPALTQLNLDAVGGMVYLTAEDGRCMCGPEVSNDPNYLWGVLTVGIPFGQGPCWRDFRNDMNHTRECCEELLAHNTSSAPCGRFHDWPKLRITEVNDRAARIGFLVEQLLLDGLDLPLSRRELVVYGGDWKTHFSAALSEQLSAKGRIQGDERWVIGQNNIKEIVILRFDYVQQQS
ncbi:MAG: hypothetical protein M1812_003197 [Candelaria pacifica]|nr:MAG: hypothetical protein M1812_003197 [Candelaria pacifica]